MTMSRSKRSVPSRRVAPSLGTTLLLACIATSAGAQTRQPLWPGAAPGALDTTAADRPTIAAFLPPADQATGAAVVVFPGGGYGHLAVEKEGSAVARWLNGVGVAAFVVEYRLGPRYHHPVMLHDAQRAIRTVRANAAAWRVDPQKVGVIGFSAGGHLASTVGTHFDPGAPTATDSIERASSRPDFMMLVYPVITFADPYAHKGSRRNLLGDDPSPELVRSLSNETQVSPATPPTFLVASGDDRTVPVENSLMFYQALHAAKVPVEMLVFESGPHGFGLGGADPYLAAWPDRAAAWLRRRGLAR